MKNKFGDYKKLLSPYIKSNNYKKLGDFILNRQSKFNVKIYPEYKNIFRAFRECPLSTLKCVIIGYSPYPNNFSNGLAFGYNGDGPMPRSIIKIHKFYENDICNGLDLMFDYSMIQFSKKGILMLNLALTTEKNKSHIKEWINFTKYLLTALHNEKPDLLYVVWDKRAENVKNFIKSKNIIFGINNKSFSEIEEKTGIKFK